MNARLEQNIIEQLQTLNEEKLYKLLEFITQLIIEQHKSEQRPKLIEMSAHLNINNNKAH